MKFSHKNMQTSDTGDCAVKRKTQTCTNATSTSKQMVLTDKNLLTHTMSGTNF